MADQRTIIGENGEKIVVACPSPAQVRRFQRLARELAVLLADIRAENSHANLYQECDTLHLMVGPTHAGKCGWSAQANIVALVTIPSSDGGAW